MSRGSLIGRNSIGGPRERRREEAARWFVTLQYAELSERVLKSWKRWEAIPENREAFDAVERVWQVAEKVPGLPAATSEERADDDYDGSVPISMWRAAGRRSGSTASPLRRFVFRTFGLAAAAAVVAITLLTLPSTHRFIQAIWGGPPDRTMVVETGLGEHRQILFEDGTRIHLGAQSSVTAHFTKDTRSVVLDRGEALFSVAPDPKRPFEVNAGSGVITAVGTAFNVRRREDNEVVVTVTDGIVEIAPTSMDGIAPMSPPAMPTLSLGDEDGSAAGEAASTEEARGGNSADEERPTARRLARGQEVTYDAEGKIGTVRVVQTSTSTVWRDGRLKYLGEPLRHVIEDVNRYSRRKLVLEDPAAGTLLYSGTVFARDIDDWIAGLERIYPEIEVITTDDGRVLIRTRAARSDIG